MVATKILLITLLFLTSNVYSVSLRNFSQVQSFCAQFGFHFSSQETYMEQNSIGQWAAAQGNKTTTFWLSACQFSSNNHIIPSPPTTTLAPTTTTPISDRALIYIGVSEAGGIKKEFWVDKLSTPWVEAYAFCKKRGYKLAAIERAEDQALLVNWAANNATHWYGFWTSGSTAGNVNGSWSWATTDRKIPVNASEGYHSWAGGKPSPQTSGDQCLASYLYQCNWYAIPCKSYREALCTKMVN